MTSMHQRRPVWVVVLLGASLTLDFHAGRAHAQAEESAAPTTACANAGESIDVCLERLDGELAEARGHSVDALAEHRRAAQAGRDADALEPRLIRTRTEYRRAATLRRAAQAERRLAERRDHRFRLGLGVDALAVFEPPATGPNVDWYTLTSLSLRLQFAQPLGNRGELRLGGGVGIGTGSISAHWTTTRSDCFLFCNETHSIQRSTGTTFDGSLSAVIPRLVFGVGTSEDGRFSFDLAIGVGPVISHDRAPAVSASGQLMYRP